MINVYGPVQGDKKERFLLELEKKIADQSHHVLLGGDFNMIRCAKETVVRSIEDGWRDSMTITNQELREVHRLGSKYTWTNIQKNPVREVLDRILVYDNWENLYPLTLVRSLLRVRLDHNPIMVELTNHLGAGTRKGFRFEKAWLEQPGFREWLIKKWPVRKKHKILDHWSCQGTILRRLMRGWGKNHESDIKTRKESLKLKLKEIDEEAGRGPISTDLWE